MPQVIPPARPERKPDPGDGIERGAADDRRQHAAQDGGAESALVLLQVPMQGIEGNPRAYPCRDHDEDDGDESHPAEQWNEDVIGRRGQEADAGTAERSGDGPSRQLPEKTSPIARNNSVPCAQAVDRAVPGNPGGPHEIATCADRGNRQGADQCRSQPGHVLFTPSAAADSLSTVSPWEEFTYRERGPMSIVDAQVRRNLIDRVQKICLSPDSEWNVIEHEGATTGSLLTGYVVPPVAIGAVAGFIGRTLVGVTVPLVGSYRIPFGSSLTASVLDLGAHGGGCGRLRNIIDDMAPIFGAQKNSMQAMRLPRTPRTAPGWPPRPQIIPALSPLLIIGGLYIVVLCISAFPSYEAPAGESDRAIPWSRSCALRGPIVIGVVTTMVIGTADGGLIDISVFSGSGARSWPRIRSRTPRSRPGPRRNAASVAPTPPGMWRRRGREQRSERADHSSANVRREALTRAAQVGRIDAWQIVAPETELRDRHEARPENAPLEQRRDCSSPKRNTSGSRISPGIWKGAAAAAG